MAAPSTIPRFISKVSHERHGRAPQGPGRRVARNEPALKLISGNNIRPLPPPMAACNATGATAPWAAPLSSTGAKAG